MIGLRAAVRFFFPFILSTSLLVADYPELKVAPVSGGAMNDNYRVQINDTSFFVRFNRNASQEFDNSKLAADQGFAPPVLLFNAELGLLVNPFLSEAKHAFSWDDENVLQAVVKRIRQLHLEGLDFSSEFSPYAAIDRYLEESHGLVAMSPVLTQRLMPAVRRVYQVLGPPKTGYPCHLDLHQGNVMMEKDKVWLIDWEFAAMSDPLFDLAVFASAEFVDLPTQVHLLETYMEREASEVELAYFRVMRFLADVRWGTWAYSQSVKSRISWDYLGDARRFLKSAETYLDSGYFERDLVLAQDADYAPERRR